MPTPPPTRTARAETAPERTRHPELIARLQLAQAARPGTDILEQELRLAATVTSHREGSRQERPLVLSPAPALGRREHRELPGRRLGAVGVGHVKDAVDTELLYACDLEQAAPERGERRRGQAHATTAPSEPARWIRCRSCMQSTSGSPS
jgi:hypothetical protein